MLIPFALSLDKYVNKAGTDVGFGCLLAVALLALLYFAGARETRSLRDQLEDAHDRIASLEARVTQALRNQAAARSQAAAPGQVPSVPGRPGVVPAPSVGTGVITGAGTPRVRREPAPLSATPAVTGALLGAPAGAGAPALGSATKLIPSPEVAPAPAPNIGMPAAVPAAATVAATAAAGASAPGAYADLDEDEYDDDFEPDDTMFVPAGATAAAGGGRSGGGPAVAPPPSMRMRDDDDDPLGPPPRRTIPTVDTGPSRPRRFAGRLIGGVIALLVVAAIVVALLVITSNNNTTQSTTSTVAQKTVTKPTKTTVAFNPASVKVSVLNGTAVGGLAADVGTDLKQAGYTVPAAAVTNAAVQTATTTTVGYRKGFEADAFRVAKSLGKASGVAVTDVVPASATSITSCGTPTATGQAGTCPADVIVTVGTDLQSAATGSSTGA